MIKDETLIGEILSRYPESAQIMEDYGLHCTSCSVNAYEPIKAGAMSHGLSEDIANELIGKINELAGAKAKAPVDGIYVSERAAKKIQEFAKEEGKEGFALRITAKDNDDMEPAYGMDFEKEAKEDDETFEFHGVKIFANPESAKNLMGADIDFLETQMGSGFKITNPKFNGSSGSCGCGTGKGEGGCGTGGCC
jgi:iron-sulfur cluster assembly accessory protein